MSPTSLRSERLILANPTDPRIPRNVTSWDLALATLKAPELLALVIFCSLGLLATLVLTLLIPNYGEIVTSLQPFL
jgi:hypothetical protein